MSSGECAGTRVSPGGCRERDEMLLQRERDEEIREREEREVITVRSFTSGEGRGQGSRTGLGAAATLTHDTRGGGHIMRT